MNSFSNFKAQEATLTSLQDSISSIKEEISSSSLPPHIKKQLSLLSICDFETHISEIKLDRPPIPKAKGKLLSKAQVLKAVETATGFIWKIKPVSPKTFSIYADVSALSTLANEANISTTLKQIKIYDLTRDTENRSELSMFSIITFPGGVYINSYGSDRVTASGSLYTNTAFVKNLAKDLN